MSKSSRNMIMLLISTALSCIVMLWAAFSDAERGYLYASLVILILVFVPFYVSFEKDEPKARLIVIIAVMVSLAVIGRAAFFWIPQFKPIIAIIIIGGVSLGANAGFVIGSMSAFVSNFLFGQGPWTPFQMVAWGIIGMLAGLMSRALTKDRRIWPLILYGVISCFVIHGGLTDLWTILSVSAHPDLQIMIATYASGLAFNAILALATAIFLALLARPMMKKLDRVMIKYGGFE